MRKFLSVLLALMMVLSLMVPTAWAAEEDVKILYTNDVHTYINGELNYATLAAYKKTFGENVLLVDAGDHAQGTAYGSMDKGKTIIDLMNAAGYDAATLGNHEFDYGQEGRINITDYWAEYPYLSCNFLDLQTGNPVLDAYKIFEVGGKKIAFVGITTPESFTKSTPAYFQDEDGNYIYDILGGEDGAKLYAAVQSAIDAAKADGADYVIALGHLGLDESSQPWTSKEVIANTTGLDAFIDGHSHSSVPTEKVKDKDGNDVVLTQTGEYFSAIGEMTIYADGTIETKLVTPTKVGADAAVKEIQDAWISEIETQLGEIIGKAEVTLDNYNANGDRLVRIQETNTGDFAADALYYLFDNMDMDVDMAIMNGGGVRNAAITGDISYLTCKAIHTFGNVACLQTVTGQQILDALEWGARQAPTVQVGGFLHVAGLTYEVDASIESTMPMDENGVCTGAPTGEYRVKNVQVYNKETQAYEALDPAAEYNLAGYNYTLRDLGDGFTMFDDAVNVLDYVMEDYLVLANYVKGFADATVKADNSPLLTKYPNMLLDYATVDGSGRITFANVEEEEWDGKIIIGGLDNNLWMTKYGNVYTNCKAENFTDDLDLTWGDLVTVKFLDQELVLPVVPTYSYVDSGKPAIILEKGATGNPTGYVSLAINMGNFAEVYGIATKKTDEQGNWYWVAQDGVEFPIEVTFELAEKEGYMAEYILHELTRTNKREDYPKLTDEEFANFRVIDTTGMGENVLYRSSSPINPEIGRNTYADAAAKKAGVTVIMNLADSKEEAEQYAGFADTYYADQKVIYLCLGVDFSAEDFQKGLAEGLKFFAENEGTYLVHCTEGKDRAGFVSALLECLMGATYDEVVADYMETYENYYGVEEGTEKYDAIANSNIIKSLQKAFDVEDLSKADLAKEAEAYLAAIGLSDAEILQLKINLGYEVSPDTGDNGVALYVGLAVMAALGTAVVVGKKKEIF
ncbi:MAG: 5'-nucleotidase C-terminal domain-containing protein [Oscillospiraceae bacterium]|nr:5'-nucleotidase C-terminal domain-containing protein [Oscillospiraceae bacterium]